MTISMPFTLRLYFLLIVFFLFSNILNAQVKIKARVEISADELPTSLMLNYPASLYISQVGGYFGSFRVTVNGGITESVIFWFIDTLTGETPAYISGYSLENIFPAGVLTFTEGSPYDDTQSPLGIRNINATDCGGWYQLVGSDNFSSINLYLGVGRTVPLPPYHISFEETDSKSLMYADSEFIPIHVLDCCGYSSTSTPVIYRVEMTQGKEWCSLYDPASGKRGIIIDSLNSPDGWSSFYLEAFGEEPIEPQQCSFTVSSYGNIVPPLTNNFLITPFQSTLMVTRGRNYITYGDTTSLALTTIDASGNPTGEELLDAQYSIVSGNAYSTLQSPDSTMIGESIEGVLPSAILRTVKDTNVPDSITVLIKVVATVPCPECFASSITLPDSLKNPIYGKAMEGASIRKEILSQRLKRIPSIEQANLQSAMQKKSNEKQPQTAGSQKAFSKITPMSQTTKSSPPHLRKIQYDGFIKLLYGLAKVKVKKPVLNIQDHSPWTIWPYLPPQINRDGTKSSRGADRPGYNPRRAFTIQLKKGDGTPFPDQQVRISTSFTSQSGGHQHTNGVIDMPQGNIQGWFYGQGQQKVNPIILTTDAQGRAVIDSFIASQISGKFLIMAKWESDTTVFDTVNIQVKVPGFVEFETGDSWRLTGNTSTWGLNHPRNHWCTQKMKDSLEAVLKDFYDWAQSKNYDGIGVNLGINDMSLQWGGLFDISGDWIIDFPTTLSHSFHRVGLSVDIDNAGLKTIPPKGSDKDPELTGLGKDLVIIMKNRGGKIYNEGPIHFGFDKGN